MGAAASNPAGSLPWPEAHGYCGDREWWKRGRSEPISLHCCSARGRPRQQCGKLAPVLLIRNGNKTEKAYVKTDSIDDAAGVISVHSTDTRFESDGLRYPRTPLWESLGGAPIRAGYQWCAAGVVEVRLRLFPPSSGDWRITVPAVSATFAKPGMLCALSRATGAWVTGALPSIQLEWLSRSLTAIGRLRPWAPARSKSLTQNWQPGQPLPCSVVEILDPAP